MPQVSPPIFQLAAAFLDLSLDSRRPSVSPLSHLIHFCRQDERKSPCVLQDFVPFGAAALLPLTPIHIHSKQGNGYRWPHIALGRPVLRWHRLYLSWCFQLCWHVRLFIYLSNHQSKHLFCCFIVYIQYSLSMTFSLLRLTFFVQIMWNHAFDDDDHLYVCNNLFSLNPEILKQCQH